MTEGTTGFYYVHEMRGLKNAVVRVVYGKWTSYMLELAGIYGEPFHTRPTMPFEPMTLENGHPFAWLYRDPQKALAHEAVNRPESEVEAMRMALIRAQSDCIPQPLLPIL